MLWKTSHLISSVTKKKRQTQLTDAMKVNKMMTEQSRTLLMFKISSIARRTMQIWMREVKMYTDWRRFNVQVSLHALIVTSCVWWFSIDQIDETENVHHDSSNHELVRSQSHCKSIFRESSRLSDLAQRENTRSSSSFKETDDSQSELVSLSVSLTSVQVSLLTYCR